MKIDLVKHNAKRTTRKVLAAGSQSVSVSKQNGKIDVTLLVASADPDNRYWVQMSLEELNALVERVRTSAVSGAPDLSPLDAAELLADLDEVADPTKIAGALSDAADRMRDAVGELSSAWQDDTAGKVWGDIANILDRASTSVANACTRRGL